MTSTLIVLGAVALTQLVVLVLFRATPGHEIFRLVIVNSKGERADTATLSRRWAVVWLSLFVPMSAAALLIKTSNPTVGLSRALLTSLLRITAAVYGVAHPNRGVQDRLANTWIVRR